MSVNLTKAELRSLMLKQRRSMVSEDVLQKSSIIVRQIIETKEYQTADCIYAYISTRNEVDLRELIENAWLKGKQVAVPRVCGQDMDFYYITSYSDLTKGNFGILEPTEAAVKAEDRHALMLIPGVAYDRTGNRIGYGGGYYDRYLAKEHSHYIIAPAYELQVLDVLPTEEHDIKINKIVSEIYNM